MTDATDAIFSRIPPRPTPGRGLYCNRTLNMRSLKAIGYDMDYTLIHYNVDTWEQRAYQYLRQKLVERGWPVGGLTFDPELAVRGLIIDKENGNIVKANRFGYIKRAFHGTQRLGYEAQRAVYSRSTVDLHEDRWAFLNTFFSISEACMYSQLVEMLDARALPEVMGYADLYQTVRTSLDEAHMEGELKAEIMANPKPFLELDPDTPVALLDQKHAGKRLMLITNSEWIYTRDMMRFTFDPHLPGEMTWRDLFEVVIVSARKPSFFQDSSPIFEVVDEDGMLQPSPAGITKPGCYLGGNASQVERYLKVSGDDILYVGDHIYGDVHQSKRVRRWRTALIVRELEPELAAQDVFRVRQRELSQMMTEKIEKEYEFSQIRLMLQRLERGYHAPKDTQSAQLRAAMTQLRAKLIALDSEIAVFAREAGTLHNDRWGLIMRTGNDKSHMARQIERHADVYTSRVSNFLFETPFVYLRSPRGSLPHDPGYNPSLLPGLQD